MKIRKYLFKRIKSFGYALNGIRILFREEANFQIHVAVSIVVVIAGFCFKLNRVEWIALVLSIGFVVVTEALNTALENLSNFISPDKNESIKRIKDLAAGAVLFSALTAIVVGLMIFLPKIW